MNELERLELEFTISRVLQVSAAIYDKSADAQSRRSAMESLHDLFDGMSVGMSHDIILLLACELQGFGVLKAEDEEL